jgi:hypothetical protein
VSNDMDQERDLFEKKRKIRHLELEKKDKSLFSVSYHPFQMCTRTHCWMNSQLPYSNIGISFSTHCSHFLFLFYFIIFTFTHIICPPPLPGGIYSGLLFSDFVEEKT